MTPHAHPQTSDAAARQRIHASLGESLLVEASAGTGKTTELVARIVAVIKTGSGRIENLAAVTFTHKAAGELKIRLRQELDRARRQTADSDERRNLEDALERLEEASIGTIHAFCAQILRERPVEAKIDPAFEELTEFQARAIFSAAFREWFQSQLNGASPALRRALARIAIGESQFGSAIQQLETAGWALVQWRDFPTHWQRPQFDRESAIDDIITAVRQLAALSAMAHRRAGDRLYQSLRPVRDAAESVTRSEEVRPRDYDNVEARLLKLLREMRTHTQKGTGFFSEAVRREEVVNKRDQLIVCLQRFKEVADADLAAALRLEMWELVERYNHRKRRAGKLDFVDLLILARDLVRDNAEVRNYLQNRFTHLFIDEFQDTDPLQAELLLLLAAADPHETDWRNAAPKPGKLFLVGDPKQSIYKFRRADVVLYQEIKNTLAGFGVGIVHLTCSHRALRPIQECVNAAFAPDMVEDTAAGQAMYSPLEGGADPIQGQPSIVALPAPRPYGISGRTNVQQIDACLPAAVAGFIEWLCNESGWRVRVDDTLIPVTPRHICVLFRRFTNYGVDVTREYVKALEAREIPHLLVGSKSFHAREEVQMLRAAMAAIEWPDDELSVYATLRGYLFAIPDSALLRWRAEVGRLHPFHKTPEQTDPALKRIAEALDFLAGLNRERNRQPVVATVNRLLEHTRAHAGLIFRPGGRQALANVNRVCDLARSFEAEGGISFRAFAEELQAEADRAESTEAPVLEEGAEGVRLMTVHAAKGLEFPIVILADMTAKLCPREPDRYIDSGARLCSMRLLGCTPWELLEHRDQENARERAEGLRAAYVAATRARDLLVAPVLGSEEREGWVAPLNKALYPERPHWRTPGRAEGCPSFGLSSGLGWDGNDDPTVQPGCHKSQAGQHEVVWWDPFALRLTVDVDAGLKQKQILADAGSDESSRRYREWCERRESSIRAGERMQFDIFNPSEAEDAPSNIEVRIESAWPPERERAPYGPRLGVLVHTVLRDVSFTADCSAIERLARAHARLLGAGEDEILAAAGCVERALSHPLLRRASAAECCRRELPVALRTDGGRIMEGIIDMAFLENGRWTILDFKTDADIERKREHYERQLRWYGHALARLAGAPVTAVLLAL